VDDIVGILSAKPIGIIPEDESILISTNVGDPAVLGESRVGQAFRDLARRIHGEDVPFASLEEKTGFMARLSRLFGGS
jgi:septum site-determining protein MinD